VWARQSPRWAAGRDWGRRSSRVVCAVGAAGGRFSQYSSTQLSSNGCGVDAAALGVRRGLAWIVPSQSRLETKAQQSPTARSHARTLAPPQSCPLSYRLPVSALFLTRPPVLEALQHRITLGAAGHRCIVRPATFLKPALPAVCCLLSRSQPPRPVAPRPRASTRYLPSLQSPVDHSSQATLAVSVAPTDAFLAL
jgi:hypothetical protein